MGENTYKIILTGNGFDMLLDEIFNKNKPNAFSKNIEKAFIQNITDLKNFDNLNLFFMNKFKNIFLYRRWINKEDKVEHIKDLSKKFTKFTKNSSIEITFKKFFDYYNIQEEYEKNFFTDLYLVTIFNEWNKIALNLDNNLLHKLEKLSLSESMIKNKPNLLITTNFTSGTNTFRKIINNLLIKLKVKEKVSYEQIHNYSFYGYSIPIISTKDNFDDTKESFVIYQLNTLDYIFKNPIINTKIKTLDDVKDPLDKVFDFLNKSNPKKIIFETFGHATYNDEHIFKYLNFKKTELLKEQIELEVICNYYSPQEKKRFKDSKWNFLKIKTQLYNDSWIYEILNKVI